MFSYEKMMIFNKFLASFCKNDVIYIDTKI